MNHWKLTLSYDGSALHGWQVQPGLRTVQGELAFAIKQVTRETVLPQGSGRTDAGVHALAQVASFSLQVPIPAPNLLRALNRELPASIRVLAVAQVDGGFHARHSATGKTYEYRIFERRMQAAPDATTSERVCSPFLAPYVWDCRWPLALDAMQEGATLLCGTHDFTSFAAADPDLGFRKGGAAREGAEYPGSINPVKTIHSACWKRDTGLLTFTVRGSGFLHHMVRNIVGTLVDVGRGSLGPGEIPAILAARDRTKAGPTAPARGLFLREVQYDLHHAYPGATKVAD